MTVDELVKREEEAEAARKRAHEAEKVYRVVYSRGEKQWHGGDAYSEGSTVDYCPALHEPAVSKREAELQRRRLIAVKAPGEYGHAVVRMEGNE